MQWSVFGEDQQTAESALLVKPRQPKQTPEEAVCSAQIWFILSELREEKVGPGQQNQKRW